MYYLIKGFYNMYFERPTFKVLIIGLEGAGKTVNYLTFIY